MVLVLVLKFFTELCGENAENGKEATNYGKMKKKKHFHLKNLIDNLLIVYGARCARESDGSATPRQDSLTLSNKELHSLSVSLKYKAVH